MTQTAVSDAAWCCDQYMIKIFYKLWNSSRLHLGQNQSFTRRSPHINSSISELMVLQQGAGPHAGNMGQEKRKKLEGASKKKRKLRTRAQKKRKEEEREEF